MTKSKKKIVIFDIDGCLANSTSWEPSRGPFDFKQWMYENKNCPVHSDGQKLYSVYVRNDVIPFFVTCRNDNQYGRAHTAKWLFENKFWHKDSKLFMRPLDTTDPFVPDNEVKRQIYENNIKDKYDVVVAIEDRLSVALMWQSFDI